MKTARLLRFEQSDQGTFGALLIDRAFFCYTAELPWRNNQVSLSCIPAGSYRCQLTQSPKYGTVYEITHVPQRSHILFHAGNYVGNRDLFKTESEGCVFPGNNIADLNGQRAVLSSRYALQRMMDFFKGEDFQLSIWNSYD